LYTPNKLYIVQTFADGWKFPGLSLSEKFYEAIKYFHDTMPGKVYTFQILKHIL